MRTATTVLTDLHHEVHGSGPPVLFISGASGDAGHFARAGELLADEFTTVAFDRRGCSRSAPLPRGEAMSLGLQADDAAALVAELGLAPAVAFGTSGGGDILLELLARRPDVLRGAVVHEPALIALAGEPEPGEPDLGPLIALAASDPRAAMEGFVRLNTSDRTFEALDPEHRDRILRNGAHFFGRELEGFATYRPDAARIRESGVPVRVVRSRDGSTQLARCTARLAELLGTGVGLLSGHHAPYLGDPETFVTELRPILRELS